MQKTFLLYSVISPYACILAPIWLYEPLGALCARPRGRVGARTGSPRSLAILLSTLVRNMTDIVA